MDKSAIVSKMIDIYFKKHGGIDSKECKELKDYANFRLSKCPYRNTKDFCSKCKIHCYEKEKRELIKKVMRYSGPRIFFYHPIITIRHYLGG